MSNKRSSSNFPILLLLIMITISLLASFAGSVFYFYYFTKNAINKIEKDTKLYYAPLITAGAEVVELSLTEKNKTRINNFLLNTSKQSDITEAFVVKFDGGIIAHSDKNKIKELEGNIANDEFAYNLDQILAPINDNIKDYLFQSYNIPGAKNPFNKKRTELLKKYIYPKLENPGWIVSKSILDKKKKPVATINFFVSKKSIYSQIWKNLLFSKKLFLLSGCASLLFSIFISIIVFFHYRSLLKECQPINQINTKTDTTFIKEENTVPLKLTDLNKGSQKIISNINIIEDENENPDINKKTVKNAIPVKEEK